MTSLLSAAGRSFLRAFLSALLVFSVGILAAPDINRIYAIGVAALLGSLAAGLRAVTSYIPGLSLVEYLGHPYGDWADSFLHAFVASLIVTLIGVLGAPDLHTARSFAVAGVIGAFNAGVRALQGLATTGELPARRSGVAPPRLPYTYGASAPIGSPAPPDAPAAISGGAPAPAGSTRA